VSAARPDLLAVGLAGAAFGLGMGLAGRPRRSRTGAALITGGSRGFGLLLAREYLRRGARVAICARDARELAAATRELARDGAPVLAVPCDVRDAGSVRELVEASVQHFGRLDTVVHNAGVIQVGPSAHMTLADYQDALEVHLFGALHLVAAALPRMLAQRSGRIVNVASIAGLVPFPHLLPYAASKAALVGWSEGLRTELAGTGIRVTTVCPALMRTGSPRHALFKGRHREEYAWFSIADSLPGLSIGAARAARRVVRAAERGAARVVVPAPARLAVALHGAAPGLTLGTLGRVARRLPDPGGVGARSVLGSDSESAWSPSFLTALNERAAARNNERTASEA
jgi:NAD(P)-dependent dehydrogenase (short-subunit alcohol dehydrogenase family)